MAPDFLNPEITGSVFRFSVETIDIEHRGLHYNYDSSEPAIIKIRYKNNCAISVGIGESTTEMYCQLLLPAGKKVYTKLQANSPKFRRIYVMPPIGALLPEETQRDKKYLYKHINGYLSYRHIRNQMADMPTEFGRFKDLLRETWVPKLQVGEIEYGLGEKANHYGLTIRDGPFVSEMSLVGSGLQAWIQTLWFLSRVEKDAVVVLDEPDVYLHADLQKKLIKILAAEGYKQTMVATHSLEMIADVAPSEIVNVTKRLERSRPLSSSAQAQSVADSLGTNLNIQLSKVATAGKIIFVEGKDYAFLDQIAFKFGSAFYDQFSRLPHFSVGGFNNWTKAATTANAFYETSAGKVCSVMFVDKDYRDKETLDILVAEAKRSNLFIKAWQKKEIENYFICPQLIYSYIQCRAVVPVNQDEVANLVQSTIDGLEVELPDLIADAHHSRDRKSAITTLMQRARKQVRELVAGGDDIRDLVSGKKAISRISQASQENWNVQLSPMSLCRHMTFDEIPKELRDAVHSL